MSNSLATSELIQHFRAYALDAEHEMGKMRARCYWRSQVKWENYGVQELFVVPVGCSVFRVLCRG